MERLPDCARVWPTVAKKRIAAAKSMCRIAFIEGDFDSTSRLYNFRVADNTGVS